MFEKIDTLRIEPSNVFLSTVKLLLLSLRSHGWSRDKTASKKYPNLDANIIGIIRDEKFLIPKKNDDVRKNDKIYVIINSSQMSDTLEVFGHDEKVSKNILIVGGGNIGFNLAKNIEETLDAARVKIIEKNKERA